jgi:hypothetical protein
MPFRLPRDVSQQDLYNRQLQQRFEATRRVARYVPTPTAPASDRDTVSQLKELAELHATGVLTDSEFAAAKAKVTEEHPA